MVPTAMSIDDVCTYRVEVIGQVDESELSQLSPREFARFRLGPEATIFTVVTDQSGFIGLIRHLHGRGLVLLSMIREK